MTGIRSDCELGAAILHSPRTWRNTSTTGRERWGTTLQRSGNSKECAGTAKERSDNARERQNRAPGRARTPQDGIGPQRSHRLGRRVKGTFYYSKANHAKANSAAGGYASSGLPLQEAFVGSSSRYLGSSLIARPAPRTTVSVVWRPRLFSLGFKVWGLGFGV